MSFLRANAHLILMFPFVAAIAYASQSLSLFLVLCALECFSLGIHQYVHHDKQFFGRLHVLIFFSCFILGWSFLK